MKKILIVVLLVLTIVSQAKAVEPKGLLVKLPCAKQALVEWCKVRADKRVSEQDIVKIVNEAFKYKAPTLLLAIIYVESHFNKNARSALGAQGLMQVRWGVWKKHLLKRNIKNLNKIHDGIAAGAYVLQYYYNKTGSMSKALNKYVGGSTSYILKVLDAYTDMNILLYTKGCVVCTIR